RQKRPPTGEAPVRILKSEFSKLEPHTNLKHAWIERGDHTRVRRPTIEHEVGHRIGVEHVVDVEHARQLGPADRESLVDSKIRQSDTVRAMLTEMLHEEVRAIVRQVQARRVGNDTGVGKAALVPEGSGEPDVVWECV